MSNITTTNKISTHAKLRSVLADIDPGVGYCDWIVALMVIFNETGGSEAGLLLADEWSQGGHNYRGFHDVESRWNRFKLSHKKPLRMGSLIRLAKHLNGSNSR